MTRLNRMQDAYGRQVHDQFLGLTAYEIVERDDGFVDVSGGAASYFKSFKEWPAHQRRAARFVRGRVLDIGAGAGRWSLHLQGQGHPVVAIDVSPLAIRTCRLRGVKDARLIPVTRIGATLGPFETILMMGNNFGLFGGRRRARWLLRRFRKMTRPGARILAESLDPYGTRNPAHLAYHRRSRRRGRMGGQLRIRVRYQEACTPWFDYLLVSQQEMVELVEGTGWKVSHFLDSGRGPYVGLIERV